MALPRSTVCLRDGIETHHSHALFETMICVAVGFTVQMSGPQSTKISIPPVTTALANDVGSSTFLHFCTVGGGGDVSFSFIRSTCHTKIEIRLSGRSAIDHNVPDSVWCLVPRSHGGQLYLRYMASVHAGLHRHGDNLLLMAFRWFTWGLDNVSLIN